MGAQNDTKRTYLAALDGMVTQAAHPTRPPPPQGTTGRRGEDKLTACALNTAQNNHHHITEGAQLPFLTYSSPCQRTKGI